MGRDVLNRNIELVRSKFSYNPETGIVVGINGGIGWINRGYRNFKFLRKLVRAHQIAFAIIEGRVPSEIDHKNGNQSDNRWMNLREVSHRDNCLNRHNSLNPSNRRVPFHISPHSTGYGWQCSINNRQIYRSSKDEVARLVAAELAAHHFGNPNIFHSQVVTEEFCKWHGEFKGKYEYLPFGVLNSDMKQLLLS